MANLESEDEKERAQIAARKPLTPPSQDIRQPGSDGQDAKQAVVAEFSYTHSGQFPDPYTLQAYKQVDPELVPTIITMAKAEAQHRQDMERMVKQTGARRSTWGMAWGGLLGLTAIGSATYLGMHGVEEVAIAVVGLPMLGFLTSFIVGSNNNRAERIEKEKIRHGLMEQDAPAQEGAPQDHKE